MRHDEILATLQNLTGDKPKQKEIAEALDMPINTIGNRAVRNSNYSVEEIEKLSQYFKCNILAKKNEELTNKWLGMVKDDLINTYVDNKKTKGDSLFLAPIEASCGNGITIDTSLIGDYDPAAQYTFAAARGDSMQPTINNNDVVIVKKYNGNFVDGVYLFSIGNEMYIKRLTKNINQLVCISDNKEYDKIILKGDELDTVNIIGSVVTVIRNL